MRGKRKVAEKALGKKSRRTKAIGRLHAVEVEIPSRRRVRVVLPLVRSKQPGTVALDNAKIFEIIIFP